MSAIASLFGGNSAAEKAAKEQQQLQAVANDRQLAEQNRQSDLIGASRRAPRGRRLFEDPTSATAQTSKTLGNA